MKNSSSHIYGNVLEKSSVTKTKYSSNYLAAPTYLTFQVETKGTPEEPASFVLYQSNVKKIVF
jgi:hypothetical protein